MGTRWRMDRNQDLVNGMLTVWNEEWNGRGLSEASPVVVEDDEYADLLPGEDAVELKGEVKKECRIRYFSLVS